MSASVIAATASRRARTALAQPSVTTAAWACVLSFTLFWAAQRLAEVTMIDLMVYRAEGWTVRAGGDLYAMTATDAELPTTYPPFAPLLFTSLTYLDVSTMRTLATIGNLLLLAALAHLSLRLILGAPRPALALWVSAALVWCEPVWTTLRYGQVNLLLTVLVLWDLSRDPRAKAAGIGIGIAAAIKLTPALFVVYLLLAGLIRHRRSNGPNPWLRQAAVATATFCTVTAMAAAVLPYDSKRFWTDKIFEAGRAGFTEQTANQSLRGVLARLLHTGDPGLVSYAVAAVVVAAGLWITVLAALRGHRAWAATACATTALLVSPISWSHHWVWCVPIMLLLARETLHRATVGWWVSAACGGLAFYSYMLWYVPHREGRPELHQNAGEMLLSAVYPLAGLAFLVLAALMVTRWQPDQAVAKE